MKWGLMMLMFIMVKVVLGGLGDVPIIDFPQQKLRDLGWNNVLTASKQSEMQ